LSQERELHELREAVALSYRALCHFGIIQNLSLSLGHVSARIPGTDRIVGTPRGIWRQAGLLTAEDTVINDLDGKVVEAPSPSVHGLGGQISVHLEIYKARPDVGGVIRAHPRYAGLLTVLKKPIVPMMSEGCELFLKPIHVYTGEGDRNYWVGAKDVAQEPVRDGLRRAQGSGGVLENLVGAGGDAVFCQQVFCEHLAARHKCHPPSYPR